MSKLKVIIDTVPHKAQRYPTVGDWYYDGDGCLFITVSELPEDSMLLVAAHELIEAELCRRAGITNDIVDAWDMAYEKNRKEDDISEPGDDINCPYHKQHVNATRIEILVALFLDIDWNEYQKEIDSL